MTGAQAQTLFGRGWTRLRTESEMTSVFAHGAGSVAKISEVVHGPVHRLVLAYSSERKYCVGPQWNLMAIADCRLLIYEGRTPTSTISSPFALKLDMAAPM